jgi:hypothetical protein
MEQDTLEQRDDLFGQWIIHSWFSESGRRDMDFEEDLNDVWITLFSSLYDDLGERLSSGNARDTLFLEFSNVLFPSALDTYKWYASEKVGGDIGLLAALNQLSGESWYIELLSHFSQTY